MIFTCLSTGSDGNAYILESEKAALIIEAGKGTFKKIVAAVPEGKKVVGVIYSHVHNDHFGDVEKIGKMFDILQFNEFNKYEDEFFIIKRFFVWHNVECFGFAIFCKEENKTVLFMTDFAQLIDRSFYVLKVDFLAIELSYNSMIYASLTEEQKRGLEWHCSDFHAIGIMRKLFTNNHEMKAVTIHKSDRACNYGMTNKALYKNFGLRAEIVSIGKRYIF
jgi:hypothetical protein